MSIPITPPTMFRPGPRSSALARAGVLLLALLFVAVGCRRDAEPAAEARKSNAAPAAAVTALATRLQAGDLAGYARLAVPPDLHAELEAAWRADRSRWPLSELPFAAKFPPLLSAFAAEDAEAGLLAAFDRQFAGADRELDAAAESLSVFGVQYVQSEGDFSDAERLHYAQVIEALGAWAKDAPLADRARAATTIRRLASAARATGLDEPADFTALGMQESLERLQPFMAAMLRTLGDYGLDLSGTAQDLQVEPVSREGDRATVRVAYPLAGRTVTTELQLERIDGAWYPSDSVRNARASLTGAPAAPEAGADDAPQAATAR